jgi:hypothetical protein
VSESDRTRLYLELSGCFRNWPAWGGSPHLFRVPSRCDVAASLGSALNEMRRRRDHGGYLVPEGLSRWGLLELMRIAFIRLRESTFTDLTTGRVSTSGTVGGCAADVAKGGD